MEKNENAPLQEAPPPGYPPQGYPPQGYPPQGGGYGAYPPAGYPGYGGQPPGYTTTTTTTTVVGAQPSRAGLSPGDQATAARRQRERENDRKLFGLLCGGCLCALCVGVDRAADMGIAVIDTLLCMRCHCFGF